MIHTAASCLAGPQRSNARVDFDVGRCARSSFTRQLVQVESNVEFSSRTLGALSAGGKDASSRMAWEENFGQEVTAMRGFVPSSPLVDGAPSLGCVQDNLENSGQESNSSLSFGGNRISEFDNKVFTKRNTLRITASYTGAHHSLWTCRMLIPCYRAAACVEDGDSALSDLQGGGKLDKCL